MIVALAIAVLALGITLGAERSSNGSSTPSPSNSNSMTINNDTTSDICLTKDCVELSSQISRSLDPSVDPCENFYQFACNRFVQENIIPAGNLCHKTVVTVETAKYICTSICGLR